MATGADNTLYLSGRDIYAMDVTNGKHRTVIESNTCAQPGFSTCYSLTVRPTGDMSGEFVRLYSAAEWPGKAGDEFQHF